MNKVYSAVILATLLLSGCAGKVSPAGKKTRQIDISWKNSCIYIGSEETSSSMKFGAKGNYDQVRNNIKNITAEMGGNSYMVNDLLNDGMGHYSANFEIYNCKETKYHVPTKYKALERLKELHVKGILTDEEFSSEKAKLLNANK